MGFVGLVFSLFRGILWITGFDRIEDYFAGLKRNCLDLARTNSFGEESLFLFGIKE